MYADYYLETIQTVFQDYKLVHGTWDVRSPDGKIERVRPQDITTTALFTVEGELDDISGSGQTEAAHDLCSGIVRKEQRHLEAKGAGHYGIFSGRRWREVVYPQVRAFILEHEKPQAKIAAPVTETPDDNPPYRAAATTKAAAPAPKAAAKPLVKTVATAAVKAPVKAAAKTPTKPTAKAPAAVATRWVAPAPAATTSKPTGAAAPADVGVATPAKTTVTAAASARTRRKSARKA